MASSTSRLFEATPALSIEAQANIARELIKANELYSASNSLSYSPEQRSSALAQSGIIAKRVLGHLPNDCSALNLMARIELDSGNLSHAHALLNKALQKYPKDQNTRLNFGYLMIAMKDYPEAEQSFRTVLDLNTHSSQAFSGIAMCRLKQKDYLGAFNHYRRLIELGGQTATVEYNFLESVEYLSADYYQADLENLILHAFSWNSGNLDRLARLAASLLVHKYGLDDDNAVLDLEQLVHDPLLLEACTHCLMPSVAIEALIVELRKTVLTEVALTRSLRDDLLPLAVALGRYAARCDYVLMRTQDEDLELTALCNEIHTSAHSAKQPEDLAGATIIVAMYEPLYTQSFSYRLLAFDNADWPLAIQDLLKDALYDLSEEHQTQYELFGTDAESILNDDVRRASNRWSKLPRFTSTSLYQSLCRELDPSLVPSRFERDRLNVLVVGSGSGQRACYLAECFKNLNIYAIDNRQYNIAYATLMAKRHHIENVRFIYADLDSPLVSEEPFDIIEFGESFNHVKSPRVAIDAWKPLLADDGLIRLSLNTLKSQETNGVVSQLVRSRNLSATTDNICHLRNAISKESGSGLWSKLFNDDRFYTGAGCKELFFPRHSHYFDLKDANELLKDCHLNFLGFVAVELPEAKKSNELAPYSLLAWHAMDQDQSLFQDTCHFYCNRSFE